VVAGATVKAGSNLLRDGSGSRRKHPPSFLQVLPRIAEEIEEGLTGFDGSVAVDVWP